MRYFQTAQKFIESNRAITGIGLFAIVASVYALATDGVLRDDAYIFFQYARNWAEYGELSFNRGEPSYAVTSILWTELLGVGTLLFGNPVFVAKLYGIILGSFGSFLWVKWVFERLGRDLSVLAIVVAALLPTIGAGRMVTGMETALICFLSGLLLNLATRDGKLWALLSGCVAGLLALARPELAVGGIGLLLWFILKKRYSSAVLSTVVFLALSSTFPIWLFSQTGSFVPPTMDAKLSVFLPEHLGITISEFRNGSFLQRLTWGLQGLKTLATSSFSGAAFFLLLSGTVTSVLLVCKSRNIRKTLALFFPPAFVFFLMIVYMFNFPLLKLRYFVWLVPALSVVFIAGMQLLLSAEWYRRLATVIITILLILFVPALARRVKSTSVQRLRGGVGILLKEKTAENARIALEPIGEIGYYSDRYIIDMGGLISEKTREYLSEGFTNVDKMWDCLIDQRADYLVTYDNNKFLGRLTERYPGRFELVAYLPENESSSVRYKILLIKEPD